MANGCLGKHSLRFDNFNYTKDFGYTSTCPQFLTLVLRICPAFANSVDPDQLASEEKPTDLDLHCLALSMRIRINNLDQLI